VNAQRATIVVDLAFGDCGKGSIVDFLTREHADAGETPLVVRFNGGPQAGHNVVTEDGRHHTFAQFGSGTFVPGVRTLLSRFMLIEPYALINEAEHLRAIGVGDALGRLVVDDNCLVITPPQQAANRLRELARGVDAHGTCGMGVGEAMADAIEHPELTLRARDLRDRATVATRLRAARDLNVERLHQSIIALQHNPRACQPIETLYGAGWIDVAVDNYAWLADQVELVNARTAHEIIRATRPLIFEGAQGVLLDENHGFHPHTTWSTTTFANAEALLDEASFSGGRTRLGVLRSYFTRHGPGPFVTQDATLLDKLPEPHNNAAGWQGGFRVGAFDAVAARYAISVAGGVDEIALTHLDRLSALPPNICTAYQCDRNTMRDIPVDRAPDLARQEQLTRRLLRCRPVYTPIDMSDADRFVEQFERELGVPVGLTSHAPTAAAKRRRIVSP
jgi:adenylosuccinate synthase